MILYKLFLTGVFLFIGIVIFSFGCIRLKYDDLLTRKEKMLAYIFIVGGVIVMGLGSIFWL